MYKIKLFFLCLLAGIASSAYSMKRTLTGTPKQPVISYSTMVKGALYAYFLKENEDLHYKALIKAIKENNIEAVQELCKTDVALNKPLYKNGLFNLTPLMLATLFGHRNIVILLLKAGADSNAQRPILIHKNYGFTDTVQQTALDIAQNENQREIHSLLTLHTMLTTQGYFVNPLKCITDSIQLTNTLNPQYLHYAAIFGQQAVVHHLIEELKLPFEYINHKDEYGRTPLMYALMFGNFEIVQTLVKAYIPQGLRKELNVADTEGKSAFMHAVETGDIRFVKALTDSGARPTTKVIEYATKLGLYELAIRLLSLIARQPTGEKLPVLL